MLVLDGRGEAVSHLAGHYDAAGALTVLASQELPHSLGLLYEDVTEHLGFLRSSDEYKVMALASYGTPRHLPMLREAIRTTGDGGFRTDPVAWGALAKRRGPGEEFDRRARRPGRERAGAAGGGAAGAGPLAARRGPATGALTMAGGVALNCVANSRLAAEGPFETVWVQPAAGDAGTALGGALHVAAAAGSGPRRWPAPTSAGAGPTPSWRPGWTRARWPYTRPDDLAGEVAEVLAADGVVAWFAGRVRVRPAGARAPLAAGQPRPRARR